MQATKMGVCHHASNAEPVKLARAPAKDAHLCGLKLLLVCHPRPKQHGAYTVRATHVTVTSQYTPRSHQSQHTRVQSA